MSAPNDQYALPTGACDTEPPRDMTYAEPVRHNGSHDDPEGHGDHRPPVAIAPFPKAYFKQPRNPDLNDAARRYPCDHKPPVPGHTHEIPPDEHRPKVIPEWRGRG